jgi:tRNA modification GTPase
MSASRPPRRSPSPSAGDALFGDTIAAIATAPGRGAVAIVRLSGSAAASIAAQCVAPWPVGPRVVSRAVVRRADGALVDDGLVTWFPAPHSFTGEDTVEFAGHGGMMAPAAVLAAFVRAGARPALPGEFTRRAVLLGKLDLLQAEALGDVIDAPTGAVQRAATAQLSGALSQRIAAVRESLLDLEALLAYDIDFPMEDDGPVARARITATVDDGLAALAALLATVPVARVAREGAVVVLAGAPNTGKSSLFNALLGEQRALVTAIAGTTRDAIDAVVDAEPYPWRVVDTAGWRDTDDELERLGIEVSAHWLARADVVLLCGAAPTERAEVHDAIRARTTAVVVTVHTKADQWASDDAAVAVSARDGTGLLELRAAISAALAQRYPAPSVPLVLHARQAAALERAREELAAFRTVWIADAIPATVAAVHVRAAVLALDEMIGAVDTEDVLGRVFARFCVGK